MNRVKGMLSTNNQLSVEKRSSPKQGLTQDQLQHEIARQLFKKQSIKIQFSLFINGLV